MNGKLIGAFPGKRFDSNVHYSNDGRGGWCLSQMNVDRSISTYEHYYLVFCFAGLIENAEESSRVESTRVIAEMEGEQIGSSEKKWRPDNKMWTVLHGDAIFEWAQLIEMEPKADGLINFTVSAKLTSQTNWVPLEGKGYARIHNIGESLTEVSKFRSSWRYNILQLLPRRLRWKL